MRYCGDASASPFWLEGEAGQLMLLSVLVPYPASRQRAATQNLARDRSPSLDFNSDISGSAL
jgi:hypothetical protein